MKNFTPIPNDFYDRKLEANLPKVQNRVLEGVMREILRYPRSRETLQAEISTRYLGEKLNIDHSDVAKAMKKLEGKNFIEFVKKSFVKGVGSIIKLVGDLPTDSGKIPTENEKSVGKNTHNHNKIIKKESKKEKFIDSDLDSLEITFNKQAINTAASILVKKGFTGIKNIVSTIADYINSNRDKINNPEAYLVQSAKNYNRAAAVKSVSVEETEKVFKNWDEGKEAEGRKREEIIENFKAGYELLKSVSPERLKIIEGEVMRREGRKWIFTLNKEELIVKTFIEFYGENLSGGCFNEVERDRGRSN